MNATCLLSKASKEDNWLWHRRLCHQNFKDMNKLVSKVLVKGLPDTRLSKDTLCPVCEQGKMRRSSHPPRMDTNSKNPLDMIHMDLCGPMRVESLARKKYMLVLVDEFSRFTWLEFLRAKSDAADRIIVFIKRIQVLLGHKVKKLHSDNGTEFRNAKLQSFLEDVGISHNFSAVRTPQQNGVVERKNQTLCKYGLFLAPKVVSLLSKSDKFLQKTDLQQIRQEEYSGRSRKLEVHSSRREEDGSRHEDHARATKESFAPRRREFLTRKLLEN
ncbi:hypothetical protein OSB04_002951 [Centaurea solstitialis]|uniref:Integrase catalytic domain-containing protein n=1 Tax=Centaurea solstitialis TaxID=347529 RepID=A0AA38TTY0_9ASTR|nr:hypothetical protein OSB04_002951 [Centaurea solstitialis]